MVNKIGESQTIRYETKTLILIYIFLFKVKRKENH